MVMLAILSGERGGGSARLGMLAGISSPREGVITRACGSRIEALLHSITQIEEFNLRPLSPGHLDKP